MIFLAAAIPLAYGKLSLRVTLKNGPEIQFEATRGAAH
jgi:hypothetical protein